MITISTNNLTIAGSNKLSSSQNGNKSLLQGKQNSESTRKQFVTDFTRYLRHLYYIALYMEKLSEEDYKQDDGEEGRYHQNMVISYKKSTKR